MSEFENEVLNITKDFIQTIAIIDDRVKYGSENDYFDADRIIKEFAVEGKLCSVYNFTEKDDIEKFIAVSRNSDITVLDWKMTSQSSMGTNSETVESDDESQDDEEEDFDTSKGHNTIEILKQSISNDQNRLKLFVIYTDEIDFVRINEDILRSLQSVGLSVKKEGKFSLVCNNNKIVILGKEAVKSKVSTMTELIDRCYSYEELPEAIYKEYSNISKGIVSSLVMKSITSIRENTYCLMEIFNNNLDTVFIAHKSVLPEPEDAHEQIIEIVGSEIKNIINGSINNNITTKLIDSFVDTLDETHLKFEINPELLNDKIKSPTIFSKEELKLVLSKGVVEYYDYHDASVRNKTKLSKEYVKNIPSIIVKSQTPSLSSSQIKSIVKKNNVEFANLTTTKKRYKNSTDIYMNLGVVVKGTTCSGADEYYICIQPKCDCLRISETENNSLGRNFTFISLSKRSTGGEIQVNEKLSLQVDYNIKSSKQILFRPSKNSTVVQARTSKDDVFFIDTFGKRYDFLCELKNDFAQSISNNFAAQISRVGMNHSEWLRLNNLKF